MVYLEEKGEEKMKGRKDPLGLRGATRDYRIVYAVVIGLTLGALWAYLRPHGMSTSSTFGYDRLDGSSSKVGSCRLISVDPRSIDTPNFHEKNAFAL